MTKFDEGETANRLARLASDVFGKGGVIFQCNKGFCTCRVSSTSVRKSSRLRIRPRWYGLGMGPTGLKMKQQYQARVVLGLILPLGAVSVATHASKTKRAIHTKTAFCCLPVAVS